MRKRSKYKPKKVIVDVMSWIKSGWMKMSDAHEASVVIRTRNHMSLDLLRRGNATNAEVAEIINAMNVAEALAKLDIGAEFMSEIMQAQRALVSLIDRHRTSHRFILTAHELNALNLGMEVHDAQLNVATINDIEKALEIERKSITSGNAIHVHVT